MLARAPRFLWILLASSVCNVVAWGLLVGGSLARPSAPWGCRSPWRSWRRWWPPDEGVNGTGAESE